MTRHPLILRLIHWFTALMLIPMLVGGYFVIRPMPSTEPLKLDALEYHMAIGVFLVVLTVLRLVLRLRIAHPTASGAALWAHRALYALIILMPVSGFTMVFAARLNDIVFARTGAPLPADMSAIPGHFWHGATAAVLVIVICLHVLGAAQDPLARRRMV